MEPDHKEFLREQASVIVKYTEQELLQGLSPLQIVVLTLVLIQVVKVLQSTCKCLRKTNKMKIMEKLFRIASYIPQVKAYINKESDKTI